MKSTSLDLNLQKTEFTTTTVFPLQSVILSPLLHALLFPNPPLPPLRLLELMYCSFLRRYKCVYFVEPTFSIRKTLFHRLIKLLHCPSLLALYYHFPRNFVSFSYELLKLELTEQLCLQVTVTQTLQSRSVSFVAITAARYLVSGLINSLVRYHLQQLPVC